MNKFGIDDRLYDDFIFCTKTDESEIVDMKQLNMFDLQVKLNDGSYIYDNFTNRIRRLPDNIDNMTDKEMANDFMHRLNAMRKRNGYTLKDLSDITGISLPTLSRYANGESTPTVINVRKLVKALHCRVEDLIMWYK